MLINQSSQDYSEVKISKHIKKRLSMLEALLQCSLKERVFLLKVPKRDLIQTVCHCIANIVFVKFLYCEKKKEFWLRRKKL